MYLIADSGSTKCDWILLNKNGERIPFSTMGFNPFFHNEDVIENALKSHPEMSALANQIEMIFLYSAGCSSRELKQIVERGLQRVFTRANIYVDHDLVAAAFATYSGEPGITCILGTGSNSCFFDGDNVSEEVPALGYILGDEGSGSYFGKRLLRDFLYHKLPAKMNTQLEETMNLNKREIFENVYMKPNANVYLASFMHVLSDNKNEEWVRKNIAEGMSDFMKAHVLCFKESAYVPVHFIGSIAFHFEDILREQASMLGLRVGNLIQKPIQNLVDYHVKYLIKQEQSL